MRVLAAIPSYGVTNLSHLREALKAYAAMPFEVRVVVFSDAPKDLGPGVEVQVGLPYGNPMALPCAHKRLFAEHLDDYDLFIYGEDDTPITARNVQAFLDAAAVLPELKVPGFLRLERDSNGRGFIPTIHGCYHWDIHSVHRIGSDVFAHFGNYHSAAFILTRAQLRHAIRSGGFLVGPSAGDYGMLETAATDPYTRCGLLRVINVSHIGDFLLPHLSNKNHHRFGISEPEFRTQLRALQEIAEGRRSAWNSRKHVSQPANIKWQRDLYQPVSRSLVEMVAQEGTSVLSVGTAGGYWEAELVRRGIRVYGLGTDTVTSAWAEEQGVQVLYCLPGELGTKHPDLGPFDCVVFNEQLYCSENPVELLREAIRWVRPGGRVVIREPNLGGWHTRLRRLVRRPLYRHLGDFRRSGVNLTTRRSLLNWCEQAGMGPTRVVDEFPTTKQKERSRPTPLRDLFSRWVIAVSQVPVPRESSRDAKVVADRGQSAPGVETEPVQVADTTGG